MEEQDDDRCNVASLNSGRSQLLAGGAKNATFFGDMKIVNFAPEYHQIGASGKCPHCGNRAYFKPVASAHVETVSSEAQVICNAAQCEACKKSVLVVGIRNVTLGNVPYRLEAFYPDGKANDRVDPSVPPEIARDFSEALRCQWVGADRATVTMCRRAIQNSCLAQGADKSKNLFVQIDELASRGLITAPLKEFAHEVRLEGNVGAHPGPDGLDSVTSGDADDIIAFTREYLHHVYVMPARLVARKVSAASSPALMKNLAGSVFH